MKIAAVLACFAFVAAFSFGCEEKKTTAPAVEAPKVEAPKVEAPKVEAPKVEAPAAK